MTLHFYPRTSLIPLFLPSCCHVRLKSRRNKHSVLERPSEPPYRLYVLPQKPGSYNNINFNVIKYPVKELDLRKGVLTS